MVMGNTSSIFGCISTPLGEQCQSQEEYPTGVQFFCQFLVNISSVTVAVACVIWCCKSTYLRFVLGPQYLVHNHTRKNPVV